MAIVIRRYSFVGPPNSRLSEFADPTASQDSLFPATVMDLSVDDSGDGAVDGLDEYMALLGWVYTPDAVPRGKTYSLFRNTSISTSSSTFVNAMDGGTIVAPEDGTYLAAWEGNGHKSAATTRMQTAITLDGAEIPMSVRETVWGDLGRFFSLAGSALVSATQGQQFSVAYRRPSGGGSVAMGLRHLWVMKVV